LEILKINCTDN